MDEKIRCQIQLPKYHSDIGRLWAWAKGRAMGTLVSDVFQARCEANKAEIYEMLDHRAKQMGVTRDELIDQILADNTED